MEWRSVVETLFATAPPAPSAPESKPGPSPLACEHRDVLPGGDLTVDGAGCTDGFHDRGKRVLATFTFTSEEGASRKLHSGKYLNENSTRDSLLLVVEGHDAVPALGHTSIEEVASNSAR